MPDLSRLLAPKSVAIVGASPTPGALGNSVLRNLDRHGFAGAIHLINPKRDTIDGRPCLKSIAELPEGVDAAVLAIPGPAVLDAFGGRILGSGEPPSTGSGQAAEPQVIYDEPREAEGKQYFRLGALEVSPDGRYAAILVDDDGSRADLGDPLAPDGHVGRPLHDGDELLRAGGRGRAWSSSTPPRATAWSTTATPTRTRSSPCWTGCAPSLRC